MSRIWAAPKVPDERRKDANLNEWSVYVHVFPDGSQYVGIAKDCKKRWSNGNGYKNQKVYEAIERFGWENIEHNIVAAGLPQKDAELIEESLIRSFSTVKHGHNVLPGSKQLSSYYSNSFSQMISNIRDISRKCGGEVGKRFSEFYDMVKLYSTDYGIANVLDYIHLKLEKSTCIVCNEDVDDAAMYIVTFMEILKAIIDSGYTLTVEPEDVHKYYETVMEGYRKCLASA